MMRRRKAAFKKVLERVILLGWTLVELHLFLQISIPVYQEQLYICRLERDFMLL